jgi:hypothetical protein
MKNEHDQNVTIIILIMQEFHLFDIDYVEDKYISQNSTF